MFHDTARASTASQSQSALCFGSWSGPPAAVLRLLGWPGVRVCPITSRCEGPRTGWPPPGGVHVDYAPAWPPFLAGSSGRDSIRRLDQRTTVTGVTILQGDGALAVEIKHAREGRTGILRWDQPPSLRRVAAVLLAHLGRSITSLGDLDILGFYGSELRQQARRLLDSGDARGEWLALVRSEPGVVLSYRPRSSPPNATPSAASATTTVPEWPTTCPMGGSFDCTRRVKRSGSRSGIAPADPRNRHRSRPAPLRRPRDERGDLELVFNRAVCDSIAGSGEHRPHRFQVLAGSDANGPKR